MHDGTLGVIALSEANLEALALSLTVHGVNTENLDAKYLLDCNLDLSLVGTWVNEEGVLILVKKTKCLFRDNWLQQDFAVVFHADTSTSLSRATAVAAFTNLEGAPAINSRSAVSENTTSSETRMSYALSWSLTIR